MAGFAQVILDRATGRVLDYAVPDGWEGRVAVGTRVRVPLRHQVCTGTVMATLQTSSVPGVRPLHSVIDDRPQITPVLLRLAAWMADYYACDQQEALRSVLPRVIREGEVGPLERRRLRLTRMPGGEELEAIRRKAPRQAAVLQVLERHGGTCLRRDLLREAGPSDPAIKALERRGFLTVVTERVRRVPGSVEYVASEPHDLSAEQEAVLEALRPALTDPAGHQPFLLKGVTGSGKTEIYLRAIAAVLETGRTALVLVPEIALTPQTVERFQSRFAAQGVEVAVLHSHLSEGERHDEWHRIRSGTARIVIGARGAIFAPLEGLGLIVVDEEHDTSYKQDEAPRYHARDLAVVRGKMEPCAVLLGSATPSLESWHNARGGKYTLLQMTQRHDGRRLPVFRVVDMRLGKGGDRAQDFLTPKLCRSLEERLARGEQSILFLNRRGFFTTLLCQSCGEAVQCPHCSVSMALHKRDNIACCHICGHRQPPPRRCPKCGDPGIQFNGVGTEKVEEAVRRLFPQARVARMDSDSMQRKHAYHETLGAFRARKLDVLVGTQMIAKGLHFPGVTLVGIINADLALHLPDFRAAERTFQLLVQVAGRAGRGDAEGEVVVQTFTPFSPAIQFAKTHDYDGFVEQEVEFRERFAYPPRTHMILLTVRADTEQKAAFTAETLARHLQAALPPGVLAGGAAPAPLARVRGLWRYQVMLRSERIRPLTRQLRTELASFALPEGAFLATDVDPVQVL